MKLALAGLIIALCCAASGQSVVVKGSINVKGASVTGNNFGPPTYTGSCALLGTSIPIIVPPTTAPFSGLSGNNTLILDPEPVSGGNLSGCMHNPILQVSDASYAYNICMAEGYGSTACNPKKYRTVKVDSSDGEDSLSSIDDSQFAVNDSSGADIIVAFNPSSMQGTPCWYNYSQTLGWYLSPATYSHVTARLVYGMSSSGGGAAGLYLKSYNLTNCWSAGTPVPPSTTIYNFGSDVTNGVPSGFINETDGVNISSTDNIFGTGFSNSSTQNTAQYISFYNQSAGAVTTLNIGNGVSNPTVTTSSGWPSGSSGTLMCQNCVSGGPIPIGNFNLHNVKSEPSGTWASLAQGGVCPNLGTISSISETSNTVTVTFATLTATNNMGVLISGYTGAVSGYNGTWQISYSSGSTFTFSNPTGSLASCTTGSSGCSAPTASSCLQGLDPYMWKIGTTSVYTACPPGTTATCSGHWMPRVNSFNTSYSNPFWAAKNWGGYASTKYPNSGNTWFCTPYVGTYDTHPSGWNNKGSDQELFLTFNSTGASIPAYNTCLVQEVFGIYGPANVAKANTGVRFSHTFGGPTSDFAVQYQLGNMWQSGRFAMFTSDMMCTVATGNCTDPGSTPATYGQLGDTSGNYPAASQATSAGQVFIVKLQ